MKADKILLILVILLAGPGVTAKTLRVAVVQMESKNGNINSNLKHASKFINQAAAKGAELILLPELMSTGYILSTRIWDTAEPKNGPTELWMKATSARLHVWLGTSYLEADGEDFFNTFVLTAPDGKIAGRVRKQKPAGPEAFFFKGDAGSHVISTSLGRIGVGICYENYLCFLPQLLHDNKADLILMPHSAPVPETDGIFITSFYAKLLGIPAIMVNKVGRFLSPSVMPGFPPINNIFPGRSAIADSDGTMKGHLGGEEGILVADVHPGRSPGTKLNLKCDNQWIAFYGKTPPPDKRRFFKYMEISGATRYVNSSERKQRALAISSKKENWKKPHLK